MHPADPALSPGSRIHVGLGLRRLFPVGWSFFELALIALCLACYRRRSRAEGGFGHRAGATGAVIVLVHVANSPWLAPH
jgi:hypothetical protein